MNNTIESSKLFPYIAWTTVIAFAFFTYNLTVQLQDEIDQISSGIEQTKQNLDGLKVRNVE